MANLSLPKIISKLQEVAEKRNSMMLSGDPELLEFARYMIAQFQSIGDSINDNVISKKIDRMIISIAYHIDEVNKYYKLGQKETDARKGLTSDIGDCLKDLKGELKNITLQVGSQLTFITEVLKPQNELNGQRLEGPDGFYSVKYPPSNWKTAYYNNKTMTEKNVPGLGDLIGESANE